MLGMVINAETQQGGRLMSMEQTSAVIVRINPVNHLLHLILTLVTCGFWAFIWILEAMKPRYTRVQIWVDEFGRVATRPF